jgi:protein gp37
VRVVDPFWDHSWNPVAGCSHASLGCRNCYAQALVPLQKSRRLPIYAGTTDWRFGKAVFNGHLTARPPNHRDWSFPFRYAGARRPKMGAGQPSIIFVCDMSDLFHEDRPVAVINQVVGRVAASDHIGLLLTKRADVMSKYFLADRPPRLRRLWQESLWLGFSAENQTWFNKRWPHMLKLAQRGWFVFVNIAPMLGPVKLPPDFLKYAKWVICYGEQGSGWRPMKADWARAVKKQCRDAGLPFFFKQMAGKRRIPYDLRGLHEFPQLFPRPRR